MTQALENAAREAGLLDMDLLKLAPVGVAPAMAVVDLRHRFPGAFPKHVRDMTPAEFKAAEAKLLRPAAPPPLPDNLKKDIADMTIAEREAFERHYGITVNASERMRRRRAQGGR